MRSVSVYLLFALAVFLLPGCNTGTTIKGWGWTEQSPLQGGKLVAFARTEQNGNRATNHWVCHVLFVFPEKTNGTIRLSGGGKGVSADDFFYFQVKWGVQADDAFGEKGIELRYDLDGGTLAVEGQTIELRKVDDENTVVPTVVQRVTPGTQPFTVANGNLFVVHLNGEYDIADIIQIQKIITEKATLDSFKGLLPNQAGVQRLKPAPASDISNQVEVPAIPQK